MNHVKSDHWVARHSRPMIFLILTLAFLGGYLAFTIPVSVFPNTNFPRVLIAVDNGVMPIDQMMVTVTRPIEEAVNSVPGLLTVRSITSRGSAEVDLYFRWDLDMFQTLQYVNAAISRVQPELPNTARIEAHLGDLLAKRGKVQESEQLLRESLRARRKILPANHPDIFDSDAKLGGVFVQEGRFEAAEPLLLSAYHGLDDASVGHAASKRIVLSKIVEMYTAWSRKEPNAEKTKLAAWKTRQSKPQ